ncbi:MAG: tetratricopeptide repeat protein [Planctomycetota bacterium]
MRIIVALCALTLSACTGYSERLQRAHRHYYGGQYGEAVADLDALLANDEFEEHHPVLRLEKASALFAQGEFEAASREIESADRTLQVLEFSSDPASLGKYFFSDSFGDYHAPPYEKFFLPTINLLSYAARQNLPDARTEANLAYSRMDNYRKLENESKFESPAAYLLLGFLDEIEGDRRDAEIAYKHANARLDKLGFKHQDYKVAENSEGEDKGDLVVVVLNGKSPVWIDDRNYPKSKEDPEVIDKTIDAVLQAISKDKRPQAGKAMRETSHVRIARLQKRSSRFTSASLSVAGKKLGELDRVLDLEAQTLDWYDTVRSQMVGAALFRVATRVGGRIGIETNLDDHTSAPLARLTGLAFENILKEADVPDTRCWNLLPKDIFLSRVSLPVGEHAVEVAMGGQGSQAFKRSVKVEKGRPSFMVLVTP